MDGLRRIPRIWRVAGLIAIALLIGWVIWNIGLDVYAIDEPFSASPADCLGTTRFAVIGDYGDAGQAEAGVGSLVDSWEVEFIVTVGDNNYPHGEAETIDENIGQYYQSYIYPYKGEYGPGSDENRFFPALGNHDWDQGNSEAYLEYFTLPGNERYYDLEKGVVHLFILDSDLNEPDGRTQDSVQAQWLESQIVSAETPWKVVFTHHPPYASSQRGGDEELRWPYPSWGADAVIAGHDHFYERLERDGITYFVNGLGGRNSGLNPIHRLLGPEEGSKVRYNMDFGAMLVTASESCINFSFFNVSGNIIDSVTFTKE